MNRTAVTRPIGPFLLAVSAFHSESTRASVHPDQLRQALYGLLAECERESRAAGVAPDLFQEVKYALVALADELAIHSDWDHVETWRRSLLELQFFNTSFAGAEFFDRISRLWQRLSTTSDPSLRDQITGVLEVYYSCLRMGFQGRYRGVRGTELATTTEGLLTMLWPSGDDGLARNVWPAGYAGSGRGRVVRRWRLWWWPIPVALLLAIGLWFAFNVRHAGLGDEITKRISGGAAGASRDAGGR